MWKEHLKFYDDIQQWIVTILVLIPLGTAFPFFPLKNEETEILRG